MHHEFSNTLKTLFSLLQQKEPLAMATILRVHGSSYRREGARMLITSKGDWYGQISGGCLEGDILKKAKQAIDQQKSFVITYDTRKNENEPLKVALGCNGVIDILMEPIHEELIHWAHQVESYFQSDQTASSQLCVVWQDERATVSRKISANSNGKEEKTVETENGIILHELIPIRKQLLIWGAGPDVMPIVKMANLLQWKVAVAYDDAVYMHYQELEHTELIIDEPTSAFPTERIHNQTALLLASHSYPRDKAVLKQLADTPLKYIGIMGPKFRGTQMLDELQTECNNDLSQLKQSCFFPTGLDIGSDTPAEIALSIIAEIQAVFNGKQANFLKDKKKPMHVRKAGEADTIAETTVNPACVIRPLFPQ